MATVTVRNIDDAVHERLKREARANHRSLEAEIRARLEGVRMSRAEAIGRSRVAQIDPGPDHAGSVALVRALRDEE